jgi:hypothetical protein
MSNATATPAETARCLGCRRPIRAAESIATGYGSGCRAKIRKAAKVADLSAWTESQIEDARQAIEDGAVVPSNREGVFHVVGGDGTEVHLVALDGCNCVSGLKNRPPRPCWHRCAVAIVLASRAASVALVAAPAPVVALPAVPASADIWTELEALGAIGASAPF